MTFTGKVIKGKGIGHQLGFPTINIELTESTSNFEHGVYSCTIKLDEDPTEYLAALNYGYRHTLEEKHLSCEFHIINFNQNISPEQATITLGTKIRTPKQFSSLEELKKQIAKDIEAIKKLH